MARVTETRKFLARLFRLSLLLVLAGVLGWQTLFPGQSAEFVASKAPGESIDPQVREALQEQAPGAQLAVIVKLTEQADLSAIVADDRAVRLREVTEALQAKAEGSQRTVRALLEARRSEGKVSEITPLWIFNGFALKATREVIEELGARPEVFSVSVDWSVEVLPLDVPGQQEISLPEASLGITNVPVLWALGFRGEGIVVATMDTGVDVTHPDLEARWRGGSNSWFDPYGQHPDMPTDRDGHGTWTMGVLVGGDAGATAIGAAPDAQWISVKIVNDQGVTSASAIHQGFQWLLDPDGDPATPDAPHVVSNSWSFSNPGCNLEFQADLQALRAAGILPIFSAGNSGPTSSTSFSPANYPETLAVGATDNGDFLYSLSSRGPSSCGETVTTYPDLVAPGVGIRTTDLFGAYRFVTGTSFATPHVAGVVALLLSAFPNLTPTQEEAAILSSTVDLGISGLDNEYGHGRIDAASAYLWLLNEDNDGDGFRDVVEVLVGTDPFKGCADTPTPDDEIDDRWPPDFNDDQVVNILDRARMVIQIRAREYESRFDLNADGALNIFDRAIEVKHIGQSCSQL